MWKDGIRASHSSIATRSSMRAYMDEYGVTERDLAHIPVQEYANARFNPWAQMSNARITLDQAVDINGVNRYVVDGLPLKTYDCSQISDGYRSEESRVGVASS